MTIDTTTLWITIALLVGATILTRGSFLLFLHGTALPPRLQKSLRFIPPAIFAALVVPELLLTQGSLNPSASNDKLVAGCVAILVGWRTKHAFATILAGMLALHAARWLGAR